MKPLRDLVSRIHVVAFALATATALGLAMSMTAADGYLATAMQSHDARLEAMSDRAERIERFSRHIRKASLTSQMASQPDVELPFGGFVGSASRVEPGAHLKLSDTVGAGQTLSVISAQRVAPTIGIAAQAARSVELMLVTARVINAPDQAHIRFLVAVTPEKPAVSPVSTIDQRTL